MVLKILILNDQIPHHSTFLCQPVRPLPRERCPALYLRACGVDCHGVNAVIVDVEATPARTYDEVDATKTMLDRTDICFGLKPKRLAADTPYGTGKFLGCLVEEKKITPHILVWDKGEREDGTYSRSDFVFDKKRNVYICPAGKMLATRGRVSSDHAIHYFAYVLNCRICPLKPKCCPNMPALRIVRDVNEHARDVA
jgi:hypothetical protein